jgi:hypothetical protein
MKTTGSAQSEGNHEQKQHRHGKAILGEVKFSQVYLQIPMISLARRTLALPILFIHWSPDGSLPAPDSHSATV